MSDLRLFDLDAGAVRHEDPVTSVAAARAQHGGARAAILDVIEHEHAGLTDDELAAALPHFFAPTVKSARSRLTREQVLVAVPGVTRASRRGAEMQVWVLAPQYRRTETVHDPRGRVA